jgi:hypothetical protein
MRRVEHTRSVIRAGISPGRFRALLLRLLTEAIPPPHERRKISDPLEPARKNAFVTRQVRVLPKIDDRDPGVRENEEVT